MKDSESRVNRAGAMQEVSAALFELRDALVELSLSLKDLQFETDLVKRQSTEEVVRKLLQQITSAQGPAC
jgi:hypothetical protein